MYKKFNTKNRISSHKKVLYTLLLIVSVFVVAGVFMMIDASTKGTKLVQLEKELEKLTLENKSLNQLLVSSTSLGDLSEKTEELGFTKPSTTLYISQEEVVASR